MSQLLSLAALTVLAQATLKENPSADRVFATADGNIFLPSAHNLARNHARQEKLEVHEISRTGADSTDILDHIQTDAKANELKQESEKATAAVAATQNATAPATGEAVPVAAAALAQAAGKAEAVEATNKAVDAPSDEAKVALDKEVADKAAADKAAADKVAADKAAADKKATDKAAKDATKNA